MKPQSIKSKRNKTIDFSAEEGAKFLKHCLYLTDQSLLQKTVFSAKSIQDKTLIGDSFKILPCLPAGYADLIIADPPYNLTKNYHGTKFSRQNKEIYAAYTLNWLNALLPCLSPAGSIYVCCDWASSFIIGSILSEKLIVRNRITWQREKGRGSAKNWKNGMEDIWFATASENYTFNVDAVKIRKRVIAPYTSGGKPKDWEKTPEGNFRYTYPSNFWDDISVPYWSMPENTDHPAQKSEKLLAKLILASSNKGDCVLDPFSGSGSTLVTAKKLGRHYTGIEQNELYCAWGEYRLKQAEEKPDIQGFKNGIFYERNYTSFSESPKPSL